MKRLLVFLLIVLVTLAGVTYWYGRVEAPTDVPQEGGRVMDIESYVRQNINTLSPEPPVLGGTFYVTEITADNGRGTVSYEDGHIALVADFEYVVDKYGITISSFEVRDTE